MKNLQNFKIYEYKEIAELKVDDIVEVTKDEAKGNIFLKFHKWLDAAEDSLYQKGDILKYFYDSIDNDDKINYLHFQVLRGHGFGPYQSGKYIRFKEDYVKKKIEKGIFKVIKE